MAVSTVNLQFEMNAERIENYVCSTNFMERIIKASVMNIIYHRLPIPDNFFEMKEYRSIPYRGLKKEYTRTGIAQLYRKWMKGFKDAFRKKYLKEFILFFSEDSGKIEETFRFKFKYEERMIKDKTSKNRTDPSGSVQILLQNLIALGDMPKLPLEIQMHVELFYFEGTPEEYIPPYFDIEDYISTLKSKMELQSSLETPLARIDTGFHFFKLSFKTKNDSQFLQDSEKNQKTITTIDEISNLSREGVSFNLDYSGIAYNDGYDVMNLDDEDIEAIANSVLK